MLVGRPIRLGLFPGTFLQIYVYICNAGSPAYEHPMLAAFLHDFHDNRYPRMEFDCKYVHAIRSME